MSINTSLLEDAPRCFETLRIVKQLLESGNAREALQHLSNSDASLSRYTARELQQAISQQDLSEDVAVQWCYYRGVCMGMLERHDDANREGLEMIAVFPHRPDGYYLCGMAAVAQGEVCGGRDFFDRARDVDESRRGAERSKKTARMIAERIRSLQHAQIRKALGRHAELVQSIPPARCPKCGFQAALPTQRWLCPKCFTQDGLEVPVWQSDTAGVCHCCNNPIGAGSRHHCRSCGKLCCNPCSQHETLVSVLGYHDQPVRICSTCYHSCVSNQQRQPHVEKGAPCDFTDVEPDHVSTRSSVYSARSQDDD